MRYKFLAAGALGSLALAGGLIAYLRQLRRRPTTPRPRRRRVSANSLPISQVVLFSSGVGYFQREGDVDGNTRVDLSFPVQDINDLIKSMVLQDLGGGHVTRRQLRFAGAGRADAAQLRHQPDRQPDLRRHPRTRPAARRSRSSCSRPTSPSRPT